MLNLIAIEPETIAEIRNALQVIQGNAELLTVAKANSDNRLDRIISEVKRIDGLLPSVKFEGEKR